MRLPPSRSDGAIDESDTGETRGGAGLREGFWERMDAARQCTIAGPQPAQALVSIVTNALFAVCRHAGDERLAASAVAHWREAHAAALPGARQHGRYVLELEA